MGGLVSKTPADLNQNVISEIREGAEPTFYTIPNESQANNELEQKNNASFSILTYNILAEVYSSYFLSEVEQQYLKFSYRAPIIMEELRKFSSDIICLQEVDNFDHFYKAQIEELGYAILCAKRTNSSPDSVVLAAKTDKFEFVSHEILKFDEGHMFENIAAFKRGNVAIVAKLKHKESGEIINVVGTHFYWDPRFEQVKYLQMHQIIQHLNSKLDEKDRVIWLGDLNSRPYCNALQYVLRGLPPSVDNLESPNPNMIKAMEELYANLQKEEKKIKWGNVYESYGASIKDSARQFPLFSNYTAKFKDTIDHILYSKDNLLPKKLLKIPLESEIDSKALPNRRFPSDHLPLMAVFEIIKS